VPKGKSRIRFQILAAHLNQDIDRITGQSELLSMLVATPSREHHHMIYWDVSPICCPTGNAALMDSGLAWGYALTGSFGIRFYPKTLTFQIL